MLLPHKSINQLTPPRGEAMKILARREKEGNALDRRNDRHAAVERRFPDRPPSPDRPCRREFEYTRHGTQSAALHLRGASRSSHRALQRWRRVLLLIEDSRERTASRRAAD